MGKWKRSVVPLTDPAIQQALRVIKSGNNRIKLNKDTLKRCVDLDNYIREANAVGVLLPEQAKLLKAQQTIRYGLAEGYFDITPAELDEWHEQNEAELRQRVDAQLHPRRNKKPAKRTVPARKGRSARQGKGKKRSYVTIYRGGSPGLGKRN